MLAIDYINDKMRYGDESDSASTLITYFSSQKISHLPIVDHDNVLIGTLKEEDVLFWSATKDRRLLSDLKCLDFHHIYECIELIDQNSLSCIAVVDESNRMQGVISLAQIVSLAGTLAATSIPGAVLVLMVPSLDYSLVQIAQIVEFNSAKIVSMHTVYTADNLFVKIVLKLNTKEIGSVLQAFRRYDYNVVSHYDGIDVMDQFYHDRIDELFKYINI